MDDRERMHRPDPARSGPHRHWSGIYSSSTWDLREPDSGPTFGPAPQSSVWSDAIAYGVDLGYRVIEDQIEQGRRAAERMSRRSYDTLALGSDVRELTERMWRYYGDLGSLWVELIGSLMDTGAGLPRRGAGPAHAHPHPHEHAPLPAISVLVDAARPTQVSMDVGPGSEHRPLRCHPLCTIEADTPPLSGVVVERGPDARLALRVRVPGGQPPGVYTGTIVDAETGQPRGTLCVRVG
jgi:hypothetical protein